MKETSPKGRTIKPDQRICTKCKEPIIKNKYHIMSWTSVDEKLTTTHTIDYYHPMCVQRK